MAKKAKPKSTAKPRKKNGAKKRRTRLFPAASFEDSLALANAVQKHASGQKVRRLTLFDQMGKSPDSSNKYGLTKGNYQAEHLELTQDGQLASGPDVPARDKLNARFRLAIQQIPVFNALYESQKGNRLPANSVLEDVAKEQGIPDADLKECVETFIVNCNFLGILRTIAGAERLVPLEQVSEELPAHSGTTNGHEIEVDFGEDSKPLLPERKDAAERTRTCFYISPIGEVGTEHRKHADLFLGSIVEPALEEFKLDVVRADRIGKAGMITSQIIEYILKSKLVIADLSYHNPNVFYELCLRHVCRLPTVQIIRKSDKIPFDLDQFRMIQIDTSDIYTLTPNLQTYKAEIATQVRMALKDPDSTDNPISTYYPNLRVEV